MLSLVRWLLLHVATAISNVAMRGLVVKLGSDPISHVVITIHPLGFLADPSCAVIHDKPAELGTQLTQYKPQHRTRPSLQPRIS